MGLELLLGTILILGSTVTNVSTHRRSSYSCKQTYSDCQFETSYSTPHSPISANHIAAFCSKFADFKSCYLRENKKLCPLKELDIYVERSCKDIPAYKRHSECFMQVHKEREHFVKLLRDCHYKDPKAVKYESIPAIKRTPTQRCHMEITEIRCSRMAFRAICKTEGAFKYFHRQGGHTSWSGNCRKDELGID